jgi:hypothetical protein
VAEMQNNVGRGLRSQDKRPLLDDAAMMQVSGRNAERGSWGGAARGAGHGRYRYVTGVAVLDLFKTSMYATKCFFV